MGFELDDRRSPYLQAADALRDAIRSGKYAPGDQLPTVAELAEEFGIAKMTVQRAITILREEGLVISWQGRGTFVRDHTSDTAPEVVPNDLGAIMQRVSSLFDQVQRMDERLARLEGSTPTDPATPPPPRSGD